MNNNNEYEFIISYEEIILSQIENSIKNVFLTPYVHKYELDYDINKKQNKISFLYTGKQNTNGHKLRKYFFENDINIDKYISNYMTLQNYKKIYESKMPLFLNYKYHLCIENTYINNGYSEKIIDCFLTRTVPIYWGCPNLSLYFDIRGVIFLNKNCNLEDIQKIINNLDNFYEKNTEAIEINYQKALFYSNNSYTEQIQLFINNILLKNKDLLK